MHTTAKSDKLRFTSVCLYLSLSLHLILPAKSIYFCLSLIGQLNYKIRHIRVDSLLAGEVYFLPFFQKQFFGSIFIPAVDSNLA